MDLMTQQMIDDMLNGAGGGADDRQLTEMEIDALGESVNISMGAGAKALSSMLNLKVLITTPSVNVLNSEEFEYKSLFPAVGVKIEYIEGLSGFNFFVMKQEDVRTIVNIMMGGSMDGGDPEFGELYTSAISEVMNQMMGASSTSLAAFFDRQINISTPSTVIIEENSDTKKALILSGKIVVIKLKLKIGDIIDSELVNVMEVPFAKELAENLINTKLSEMNPAPPKKEEPPKKETPPPVNIKRNNERVSEHRFVPDFSDSDNVSSGSKSNLDIIMDVPLDVVVQIGRTRKPIKEIIDYTQGSIIELEKQAGEPVDIIVNGELIAKGDVVVIDDNFGVRITEIVNR